MLQNELLQEQECTLVTDALSELNLRLPSMRRVGLLAVVALQVLDDELDLE